MNAQEQAAFSKMDARIKADPEIRAILDANRQKLAATRDKGGSARDFQNRIRDQITSIAKKKGYIPDVGQAVFVNPNYENGQLELHRGWAGLNGWQRAAIIAAAAGTGVGAGMLLAGGGAAAGAAGLGGSAATAGGAGTAAAIPTIATTAGLGATIPGTAIATGSALGTAGLGAGVTGAGLAAGAAPLTTIPISSTAAAGGIPAGSLAGGGGAAASGGGYIQGLINNGAKVTNADGGGYGSYVSRLLGKQGLEGLSRGLGSVSETMANNRGTELDAMLVADNNKLAFDRNARDNDEHNWRMLQATEYVKNGGAQVPGPTKVNSGTMDPSKFGFGPKATTANEKMVASNLEKQLMERMQNPIQMRDYDSKMKAGTGEKLTGWLGAGANIASNFFGK